METESEVKTKKYKIRLQVQVRFVYDEVVEVPEDTDISEIQEYTDRLKEQVPHEPFTTTKQRSSR